MLNTHVNIKLSQFCKNQGINYRTGFGWFQKGLIPGAYKTPSGSIFVKTEVNEKPQENVVIYCRVSSYQKRDDLNRQIERCKDFASANGFVVSKIYKEVASGMNDNRKEFWKMIDSKPTMIIVENKDRLTRFGFNYIDRMCGAKVVVMNPDDNNEQDLFRDLISIITSFCCRLYGMRRGYNKAKKIKDEINKNEE